MTINSYSKSDEIFKYLCLAIFIVFTFTDNHNALFISDYYFPLLMFVFLDFISKLRRKRLIVNYKATIFLVLLLMICIGALNNAEGIDRGTFFSYIGWFVFMFVATNECPRIKLINMLMISFIIGSVIMSLMVFIFRQNYYQSVEIGLRYTIKFMGNDVVDPNYLASFLFVGGGMSIYALAFSKDTLKYKKCYFISTMIILIAMLMVGSRAGYVAIFILGLGTFAQIFQRCSWNKKKIIMIMLPTTCLIMVLLLSRFLPDVILRRLAFSSLFDYSNSLRVSHWIAAIKCIEMHPFMGYGPMHTLNVLNVYSSHRGCAHNTYLALMLHLGIMGFLLLFLLGISIFRKLRLKRNYYWRYFFIGFVFINMIIENHLGISFWVPILVFKYISDNINVYGN